MSQNGNQSSSQTSAQNSSGSISSDSDSALIVEEVYAATGQVVSEGDPILKITDDSIAEYQSQLEAAVETAQLNVKQEEINAESKKSEADYTYQMYLAEGETAEETCQATITSLEKTVSDLEEDLEEAQDTYHTIESNLQIAKNNLTTQSIEAKQTCESALTNYKYADQLYEIDTNGLEDDLDDAKETLEEAEEALADFQEQIGDGIVYAAESGTVTEVAYEAGDEISNDTTIVTYTDPKNVTMTVSVSQDDIARVAVGEEASISLTAYPEETFSGTVSGIATSATAGSAAVNYDVTVLFSGDISKVYSGMTGEAAFAGKTISDTLYISSQAAIANNTPAKIFPTVIVLAVSTILNAVYFLKTVIRIYVPEDPAFETKQGYLFFQVSRQKLYSLTIICFIVLNLILGMMSQPIVHMIEIGLQNFS